MTRQLSALRRRRRAAGIALFSIVGAGAFGILSAGDSPAIAAGNPQAVTRTTTKPVPANPLPSISVTDVRTGKSVALRSALSGKKPLLVWFWAPY